MKRKTSRYVLAIALTCCLIAASLAFSPPGAPSRAEAMTATPIQLVPEQDSIMPGGKITYYLIIHTDAAAEAKVNVPEQLDVLDAGGAVWDETARTLTWTFDGAGDAAAAARIVLEVDEEAAIGDTIELPATATIGAELETALTIPVAIGPETHQPFMQGYPDGTFRPDRELTRAETAAMIARIRGLRNAEGLSFSDVPRTHWAHRYVQQVSADGYMVGYNGQFRPEDPITKAELTALLLRLRGVSVVPLHSMLSDVIDDWSKFVIGTAETLGLLETADDTAFVPGDTIDRALAAQWVSVGLRRGPLADGEIAVEAHFPDVDTTHPFFRWIEEASSVAHESEDRGDFAEYLIRYLPEDTAPF